MILEATGERIPNRSYHRIYYSTASLTGLAEIYPNVSALHPFMAWIRILCKEEDGSLVMFWDAFRVYFTFLIFFAIILTGSSLHMYVSLRSENNDLVARIAPKCKSLRATCRL